MPVTLAVIFVPGIVLYTVFSAIFAGRGGPSPPNITLAVADQDDTVASRRLVEALSEMALKVTTTGSDGEPLGVEAIRRAVRKGRVSVGLAIPKGYERHRWAGDPKHEGVELIVDETQPIEGQMVVGMLQMAAGRAMFDPTLGRAKPGGAEGQLDDTSGQSGMIVKVRTTGVAVRDDWIPPNLVFLAGLVPLFLLFNAAGAATGLLQELQSGTIRRLLVAPISPAHILFGHMVFSMVLALLQCFVMYIYAWLVFKAPIWSITSGLLVLTIATTTATVGFGMLMASVARNVEQLNSIGAVVILGMSAIGGSMVPRLVMPAWMRDLGLLTINGWAYDGFIGLVRGEGLRGIAPEVGVLVVIGLVLAALGCVLLTARLRAAGVT